MAASIPAERSTITAKYAVDIVQATRYPSRWNLADLEGVLALGASPRATLALVRGA